MAIHKTQVCGYFRTYCRRSNDTMASRKRRDSLETGESVKRENSGLRESTSETLTAFTGSATSPLDAAVPISCSEEYVTARCAGVGERRLALIEEDRGQREHLTTVGTRGDTPPHSPVGPMASERMMGITRETRLTAPPQIGT